MTALQQTHGLRIAPIGTPAEAQSAALAKTPTLPDGTVRNLFRTLAWQPTLLARFNALAGTFMRFSEISAYDREVVILRVAATIRSRYELGQHIPMAQDAGVADATITSLLAVSAGTASLSRSDAILVRFTDALLAEGDVDSETWRALALGRENPALVELVMLVGQYRAVGDFLNVLGVELESDLAALVAEWVDW
ncbi:carboxymuconolactone decarboxylase family protein [Salinibacterium sp. ZJ454]|uniref:carboxymuconolactone decarboxylase family protein n=1 Tax=Salinibacterium sp. ZJ454 TaxID=2708339 RepID=UPI0014200049|nr:carboxymuconolactone decarboxylase family protein [Salinibacterium sp. ZJ454]